MIKNNTAQIITLPPLPFLVHSLFAIDGWLLRGGVISCDCFLTIAGNILYIYIYINIIYIYFPQNISDERCMKSGHVTWTGILHAVLFWWEDGWFVNRLKSLRWSWKLMCNTQDPEPNKTPKKIPTPQTQSHFCSHTQSSTHHNPTSVQSCYGKCYWKTKNQWPTENPYTSIRLKLTSKLQTLKSCAVKFGYICIPFNRHCSRDDSIRTAGAEWVISASQTGKSSAAFQINSYPDGPCKWNWPFTHGGQLLTVRERGSSPLAWLDEYKLTYSPSPPSSFALSLYEKRGGTNPSVRRPRGAQSVWQQESLTIKLRRELLVEVLL